jgi:hypothetical protein
MGFTHNECQYQDVPFPNGYTQYWGTSEEYKKIYDDFSKINYLITNRFNLPINIGEFGTLNGPATYGSHPKHIISITDMNSREQWTQTVALACKFNNFSFCYFDFKSIWAYQHPQFAIYDSEKKKWIGNLKNMLMV